MAAYVVLNYKIIDRSKIEEFSKIIKPIDEKYEAKVLVASAVKSVEGKALPNIVIYKFKSFEAAERWYYSAEHQEASILRKAITEGWVSILHEYS